MKKFKLILLFFLTFFITSNTYAMDNDITLYFFHGDGCPHCAEETKFLESIESNYPNLKIDKLEVWYNTENSDFLNKVKKNMDISSNGVPVTIIGSSKIIGYGPGTSEKITKAIEYYSEHSDEYKDVVLSIKNDTFVKTDKEDEFTKSEKKTDDAVTVSVPGKGKLNLKNLSLSTATVLLGLIDGFNPCAMWVLLFLISVLIGMKDRKRMWILGLTFLITSAVVYMSIMMGFLGIVIKVSTSIVIRNIIAVCAIIGGVINFRSFIKSRDSGCTVVDSNKRKKMFSKIKKFTHEKSFLLALLGIMGLAVSVNLVELACSAGLPLIFTQLLAINEITGIGAFLYTLLYIVFFLLDDMIIFFVAMFTMKVTGISTKYNKYSHLVGGLLMLIVGILLILAPELLMFNFS